MADAAAFIEQAPIQDQDLLLRLNQYFEVLDQRLRHGQGWFIFNASGSRLNRIAGFIQAKLSGDHAKVDRWTRRCCRRASRRPPRRGGNSRRRDRA